MLSTDDRGPTAQLGSVALGMRIASVTVVVVVVVRVIVTNSSTLFTATVSVVAESDIAGVLSTPASVLCACVVGSGVASTPVVSSAQVLEGWCVG